MFKKQEKKTSQVVTGKFTRYDQRRIRTILISLLAIVVIVGIIVGGHQLIVARRNSNQNTQEIKDYNALINNVKIYQDKGSEKIAESLLLDFNQKHTGQITKQQQNTIANELGAIYRTLGDYKNAVFWQNRALQTNPKPGFNDYNSLGEAYILNGDKANAVKYLKLALTEILNDKTNAPYDKQKDFITNEITSLGGS